MFRRIPKTREAVCPFTERATRNPSDDAATMPVHGSTGSAFSWDHLPRCLAVTATALLQTLGLHEIWACHIDASSGIWHILDRLESSKETCEFPLLHLECRGTAVAQWLRCCATNLKVAGSISTGASGFFIDIKSCRSTQPLTEMSTRNISWGLRPPVRKADNLTTNLCRCHEIWET